MIPEQQTLNIDFVSFHDFDFIKTEVISEQDFEYGSFTGTAEMVGFQILFFKKTNNQKNSCFSIDWGENENSKILDIAQKILTRLNSKIFLRSKLSDIEEIYGTANFTDDIYENCIIHYFLNEKGDAMYSFCVDNSLGVTRIELIHDAEIVQERINNLTIKD